MDDLIPLLIFIVIAVVNLIKFLSERGRKPGPAAPEKPDEQEPASLENFFEALAQKLGPKPVELPEWPEDRAKPDYAAEMAAFEAAQTARPFARAPTAENVPQPGAAAGPSAAAAAVTPGTVKAVDQARALQGVMNSAPGLMTGMKGARLSSSPQLRQGAGHLSFPLKDRNDLRRAILANVIFGPPRAYDTRFENTFAG